MRKAHRAVILVSPSGVEGRANIGAERRASFLASSPGAEFSIDYDQVQAVVRELRLPPRTVVSVVVAGVSEFVEVRRYDAPANAALRAAKLASLDLVDDDESAWLIEQSLFSTAGAASGPSHVMHCAIPAPVVAALGEAIASMGMHVESVVPERAAILGAMREMLPKVNVPGPAVLVYFGEHGTGLAGVVNGSIEFARVIGFGYRLLSDAFVRAAGADGDPISQEQATELLFEHGIPGPDRRIDTARGLDGARVLPLLQPALQRYVLELRHTLRMGFERGDQGPVTIMGCGRGADVPGLLRHLAAARGLAVGDRSHSEMGPTRTTPTAETILEAGPPVRIMPPAETARRGRSMFRRALAGGAAAAAMLLGFEFFAARATLDHANAQFTAMEARIASFEESQRQVRLVAERTADAELLLDAAESALGVSPAWRASIQSVCGEMPASVRLLQIRAAEEGDDGVVHLQGYAFDDQPEDAVAGLDEATDSDTNTGRAAADANADQLAVYIERLDRNPFVAEVNLRSRFRVTVNNRRANEFRLTLVLRSIPLGPAAATMMEGDTP